MQTLAFARIRPTMGWGRLSPIEPKKTLAKLILAKNEGFVAVGELESVEAGWSPKYGMVLSLLTLRDVRALWSSSAVRKGVRFDSDPANGRLAHARGNPYLQRSHFRNSGSFASVDRYLVWGYEDPVNHRLGADAFHSNRSRRPDRHPVRILCARERLESGPARERVARRKEVSSRKNRDSYRFRASGPAPPVAISTAGNR